MAQFIKSKILIRRIIKLCSGCHLADKNYKTSDRKMNLYLRDETKELLRPETGQLNFPGATRRVWAIQPLPLVCAGHFPGCVYCSRFVILTILQGETPERVTSSVYLGSSWLLLHEF